MRIAVLITCHNRSEITLRGIRNLVFALGEVPGLTYKIFVVDDGSTDGTASAIALEFPDAELNQADGSLFWSGGMCRAYAIARQSGSFDGYLLFNDDVVVSAEAVAAFFREYRSLNVSRPAVLAAATTHPTGGISYSGFVRLSRFRPLSLEKLDVSGAIQQCDTFNGNFVLVPGRFFEGIGGLDLRYIHAYGDIDLGYVAKKAGVKPYLASRPIGVCAANERVDGQATSRWVQLIRGTWVKKDSLRQRLHFLQKHSPFGALLVSFPLTLLRFSIDRIMLRAQGLSRKS